MQFQLNQMMSVRDLLTLYLRISSVFSFGLEIDKSMRRKIGIQTRALLSVDMGSS
jgi:hypothetical protein